MRILLSLSLWLLAVAPPPEVHHVIALPPSTRPVSLVAAGILPKIQTPGEYFSDVTLEHVKRHNFSATIRNVTETDKVRILHEYRLDNADRSTIEFDHLVPASLGGDNSDKNIWPESKISEPLNAHVKDRLEDQVLKLVREGKIPLDEARRKFAGDWTKLYVEVIGPLPTDEGQ